MFRRSLSRFGAPTASTKSITFIGQLKGISSDQTEHIASALGFNVQRASTKTTDLIVCADSAREIQSGPIKKIQEAFSRRASSPVVISEKDFREQFLKETDDPGILQGQRVAITGAIPGVTRSEAEHFIRYFGGTVVNTPKSGFQILVNGKLSEKSSPSSLKLTEAEASGALIIDASDFSSMISRSQNSISFRDRRVAFTGNLNLGGPADGHLFTREFVQRYVEDLGGSVATKINRNELDVLVMGNKPSAEKVQAAEEAGIRILHGDHFINILNNSPIAKVEGQGFLTAPDFLDTELTQELITQGGRIAFNSKSDGDDINYVVIDSQTQHYFDWEKIGSEWKHVVPLTRERLKISLDRSPSLIPNRRFLLQGKFRRESAPQLSTWIKNWGGEVAEAAHSEGLEYLVVPDDRWNTSLVENVSNTRRVVSERWLHSQMKKMQYRP